MLPDDKEQVQSLLEEVGITFPTQEAMLQRLAEIHRRFQEELPALVLRMNELELARTQAIQDASRLMDCYLPT